MASGVALRTAVFAAAAGASGAVLYSAYTHARDVEAARAEA